MSVHHSGLRAGIRLAAVVAAPALLVAACGNSGTTNAGSSSAGGSASSAAGGSKSATVETHSGPLGTYLTDGSGRTVYLFAKDHGMQSSCSGPCASVWPPLVAKGTLTASGGAKTSMLATVTRSDGSKQVTYHGHPLYYFASDTSAGSTSGEGVNNYGAKWWVVSPAGASITKASGSSSGSSGGGGGGGGTSGGGGGGGWS